MVDGVGGVPREVARKLAAKSKMGGGKISASVWNEYAKTRGGNTVSNYINLSDAINSISHYNQMDEVKTVAKFTPPDLAKDDGIRPKEPNEDGVIDQNGLTPDQAKELKELAQFKRPNLAEDDGIKLKEPNEEASSIAQNTTDNDPPVDGGTLATLVVNGDKSKMKRPQISDLVATQSSIDNVKVSDLKITNNNNLFAQIPKNEDEA